MKVKSLTRVCCREDSDVQKMDGNCASCSARGMRPKVAVPAAVIQVERGDDGVGTRACGGDDVKGGEEVAFGAAVEAAVEDAEAAALVKYGADDGEGLKRKTWSHFRQLHGVALEMSTTLRAPLAAQRIRR